MRRLLAITLLLAFGSPLLVPLLAATASPEASLPACCRQHGKHHCTMLMAMERASTGPAFQAPPCPNYPTAFLPLRVVTASLAASLALSVQPVRATAAPATACSRSAATPAAPANQKRGPPALLA
jgi:hypothetical protein